MSYTTDALNMTLANQYLIARAEVVLERLKLVVDPPLAGGIVATHVTSLGAALDLLDTAVAAARAVHAAHA